MIKSFIKSWEKNKDKLEEFLKTHRQEEYDSYEKLVKLIFEIVINPDVNVYRFNQYNIEEIDVLNHGDYCGTLIFILHMDDYEPDLDGYVYTWVDYGSCSGCDTLLGINRYEDGLPNERQVEDYMTLCLHLVQHCKPMGEIREENDATCDNT